MLKELRERMKFIKTCNLYLSMFTLGMGMSLTGPCLLDLQHMVHTDTQHIAMIYTARSTGYLIGSIIGGILLDLIRSKQAVLMICNLFVTTTMFGIPWCRKVGILLAFMSLNGFSLGAIETGGNVICLDLWGKDSNPIFQGLHFSFGLGGLLAPLIVAPFLESFNDLPQSMNSTVYSEDEFANSTMNFSDFSSNTTYFFNHIPKIIYPFSIIGVIALLVSTLNIFVYIISPTESASSKDTSKIDNKDRSLLFMIITVFFSFLAFFVVAGTEIGFGQTLTVFSVKSELHLSKTKGSYITSAFWAAFTITRLLCVFLSMKISCIKIIVADMSLVAIAALILLFLMPNEWALWSASIIYGTGIASAYASLVGWINTHIYISNKVSAIFNIGCAAGEMVIPFIITYFIDTIPEMFSFVTAASPIFTAILLFILHCIFKKGSKLKESKNMECYVTDVTETKH